MPFPHPVILFDGVCNLCQFSVNFIIDRDPTARFRFAALQSGIGRQLLREMGQNPDQLDSVVLIEDGRFYQKSAAALRICRRLSGLWPVLFYLFGWWPTALKDPIYDWIARNRYRWFGKQDTCRMPTPELRGRFIDVAAA
jgi:predicted DCC family thiol-disulfide oxidoreductase YuxK